MHACSLCSGLSLGLIFGKYAVILLTPWHCVSHVLTYLLLCVFFAVVLLVLVVATSAVDCLERPVSMSLK